MSLINSLSNMDNITDGIPESIHLSKETMKSENAMIINISNIKDIFMLRDNMSPIHHSTKTKTKTHSSNVLIIVNHLVLSSRDVTGQSWTKSNGDSLSNISFSRDGTTKRSSLSHRQPSTILLCPARLSKDGSES
jgi:hypothetical protein